MIFILGGYGQWDYKDYHSIGYCPYIPYVFAFGILLLFWISVSISLVVFLTVECIGLCHEIHGKETEIDFWTLHSEPKIEIMGSVLQHAHD